MITQNAIVSHYTVAIGGLWCTLVIVKWLIFYFSEVNDKMPGEVRTLTLHKGRFEKSVLCKVKKGWRVKFQLAPEFLSEENLALFTNYPVDGSEFDRDKYHNIYSEDSCHLDLGQAGSYHYYVSNNSDNMLCDGFISVDPELHHNIDSLGRSLIN